MNRPKLLSCMDCGAKVSTFAQQCPHCKTNFPKGIACSLCGIYLKHSEAVSDNSGYSKLFHKDCLILLSQSLHQASYLEVSPPYNISCPVCKKNHQVEFEKQCIKGKKNFSVTCNSCGHPISFEKQEADWPYDICYFCKKVLNKRKSVCFTNPGEISRHIFDGDLTKAYAHEACYNLPGRKQDIAKSDHEINKKKFWKSKDGDPVSILISTIGMALASFFFGINWLAYIFVVMAIGIVIQIVLTWF